MFILRLAEKDDLSGIFELSKLVNFINLPQDKNKILEIIETSLTSCSSPSPELEKNYYLFVLVEIKTKKVVGTSMIHAQHGSIKEPHFYLKVGQENKFSQTLNTGFVHGTLKLGLETHGPTEIGGLVLHPDYRNNPLKLGKQISFVRFLYMALFPHNFKEEIHSELMPPFDSKGKSPLWEAIGRRFLNMDYLEADKLARSNKEFILSLYPSETIYTTLLPIEARDAIGKVNENTRAVKKMLEGIGFSYINEIDPFDGGPHYRARLNEILPIKNKVQAQIKLVESHSKDLNHQPKPFLFALPERKSFTAAYAHFVKKGSEDFEVLKDDVKVYNIKKDFMTEMIPINY